MRGKGIVCQLGGKLSGVRRLGKTQCGILNGARRVEQGEMGTLNGVCWVGHAGLLCNDGVVDGAGYNQYPPAGDLMLSLQSKRTQCLSAGHDIQPAYCKHRLIVLSKLCVVDHNS